MNEERRVTKAKVALMRDSRFALLSGILMVGRCKVDDTMPTACTDGYNEWYGREFVKSLNDKELAFVVLHEAMHKAYKHMDIWKKLHEEDARRTNIACDHVINLSIKEIDPSESVVAMPQRDGKPIGFADPKYTGMGTKQIYDLLKNEDDGDGDGFDEHDWSGLDKLSDEEKQAIAKEIETALRQGQIANAQLNGTSSAGMERMIGDLLAPKVDWREQFKQFVRSVCSAKDTSSWRRVNRRFIGSDVYMPSMIGETVGRIVIGVDTSGSIGGVQLTRFLSEVVAIAEEVRPAAVDLMYWDSGVAQHEMYEYENVGDIVHSTKPAGGGGTVASCVADYIRDKEIQAECVVMLTDGHVGNTWGDWDVPVMWVVDGSDAVSPVGKTIHIKE